eukprot:SAG25_NODE_6226_length_577_cov_1.271967_1_plen_54_part_10
MVRLGKFDLINFEFDCRISRFEQRTRISHRPNNNNNKTMATLDNLHVCVRVCVL